jgi:TRAP-type mannitol/chloroaromatic compound transport system permease small subunit
MPFVLLMSFMLVPYAVRAYVNGEISTNAGGLLIWPARALLALGFILLSFQGLSEIIKKIAVMRGVIADPTPFLSAHELAEREGQSLAQEIGK